MKDNSYSNIFVCYGDADRDILTRQIRMFRERYHSFVIMVLTDEADIKWMDTHSEVFDETLTLSGDISISDAVIAYCKEHHMSEKDTLLIAETTEIEKLSELGIEVKSPLAMAESYKKALEMLGNMVKPRI
ncbi:hypothetical protein [Butyrivibrio sp. INlla16]|uniref:hypothetical protein n=1 Tax=Butyrivibrio sp. INlla16 TaxID=1520807 RepID=UPI00088921BA|nr:hypothetical protein [Butyrivibrio sp. INlla16]SDB69566.1 hypothetical protein SAMN02910263_04470 [Butyrivibrio sp. INlla16]